MLTQYNSIQHHDVHTHVHMSSHNIESAKVCTGVCHCFTCKEVTGQAVFSDLRGERELDLEEERDLDRFLHKHQLVIICCSSVLLLGLLNQYSQLWTCKQHGLQQFIQLHMHTR